MLLEESIGFYITIALKKRVGIANLISTDRDGCGFVTHILFEGKVSAQSHSLQNPTPLIY